MRFKSVQGISYTLIQEQDNTRPTINARQGPIYIGAWFLQRPCGYRRREVHMRLTSPWGDPSPHSKENMPYMMNTMVILRLSCTFIMI